MTDRNTIERQVLLNAPREKVWDAITRAELVSRWFGSDTEIPSLNVGQEIAFGWASENYTCRAIIERVEPMSVFAYKWEHGDVNLDRPIAEETLTLVTFTLEDVDGGTRLTLVETGFDSLPEGVGSYDENSSGWTYELNELVEFLQKEAV